MDIQTTFRIIMEVDEDSTLGSDNEQRGKDIPDPSQDGGYSCTDDDLQFEKVPKSWEAQLYLREQGSDRVVKAM